MGYRLAWLAGGAGIGLSLLRVERLLLPSADGLPWEVVLLASAVLGATISWAGRAYRVPGPLLAIIHIGAALVAAARIAVPETTWLIFPTRESFVQMGAELTFARDVIRAGIAPVVPLAGLVAIIAVVFWLMGALLAWGLLTSRPYVAVLTPLVVYLEFAVLDRRVGGWWATGFMALIGFALLAVALGRRREGAGTLVQRGAPRRGPTLPILGVATLVFTVALAANASGVIQDLVPRRGFLEWQGSSSLSGDYFGSIAYNPFVGIQQSLVAQTNVPVLVFDTEQDGLAGTAYWRLVTLDAFDGEQWHVGGGSGLTDPAEAEAFEDPAAGFAGPTTAMTADVTILALQMDWVPAPYSPVSLTSEEGIVQGGYRVRPTDGSLHFDALTYRGMTYSVTSEIPQPNIDILSRRSDGTPSVVFQSAIETGDFGLADTELPTIVSRELPDADRHLTLPDGLDEGIALLAESQVVGLETDFERALALEDFFRTRGNFTYSTVVPPGHGAEDLAAWLLDPDSDNYRVGYCEQFAASYAVMARALGIPSRVVLGFTPGSRLDDGRTVIRDRNAHAWVELWLPSQGWVKFDPTPRSDGINPGTTDALPFEARAAFDDVFEEVERRTVPGEEFSTTTLPPAVEERPPLADAPIDAPASRPAPSWLVPAIVVLLVAALTVPGVKWVRRRRRLRRLEEGDVSAAWQEIVDRLSDLGTPGHPWETPAEIAAGVSPLMEPLAEVYAEEAYGPQGPVDHAKVAVASRSMVQTEAHLSETHSIVTRVAALYRMRTFFRRTR